MPEAIPIVCLARPPRHFTLRARRAIEDQPAAAGFCVRHLWPRIQVTRIAQFTPEDSPKQVGRGARVRVQALPRRKNFILS